MGIAKKQKHIKKICKCGCNTAFNAFPIYTNKRTKKNPEHYDSFKGENGAMLYTSKYRRGHHPKLRDTQFGIIPAWNRGLKKEDHPSLSKMGFQHGHKPYTDWSHVIDKQRNDPKYREKWLKAKKGQTPWNKGIKKDQYKNGIKSGEAHGNWCGGKYGPVSTAEYKTLVKKILKRDKYTCQHCGDHNYKGRGSSINLEVHHIVAVSENHALIFKPYNLITLCKPCHYATPNHGTKQINKRRKTQSR